MSAAGDVRRPTAVSVIGWTWIVFAGYLVLRSLFDLVAWKLLGPIRPTLLATIREQVPGLESLSTVFEYLSLFHAAKAVFGAAAFVSAWRLLALSGWARVAMQVIGWVELFYVAAFAVFWSWLWPRVAAAKMNDPDFARRSYGSIGLVGGIAVCAVLAAALAAQIVTLRTGRVRAAFAAGRAAVV